MAWSVVSASYQVRTGEVILERYASEDDLLHGRVERKDASFPHSMKMPAVGGSDL
jgi:hypothetical protein